MKLPTTSEWKDAIAGSPFTDNGFQGALAEYARLGKDKHGDRLEAIASITARANALKPKVAQLPAAAKYLDELTAALELDKHEITKSRANRTICAIVHNQDEWLDLLVTIEDLGAQGNRKVWDHKPLRVGESLSIRLATDDNGKGAVHWTAEDARLRSSSTGKTVKRICEGQIVEIRVRP